jgi:isocitrate lyase
MGYKFQFVTLAGFHALNHSMFKLSAAYREWGMTAYADFQENEFNSEQSGYRAVRHQEFVGTGFFDEITRVVTSGMTSTLGLAGSTEEEQFHTEKAPRHVRQQRLKVLKQ